MECVLGCGGRVRMGSSGLCYRRHPLTVSHGVCDLLGADWNVRQVSPLGLLPVRTLPATVYRPVHDTSIRESRGPSVYVLLLAATWLSSVLLCGIIHNSDIIFIINVNLCLHVCERSKYSSCENILLCIFTSVVNKSHQTRGCGCRRTLAT